MTACNSPDGAQDLRAQLLELYTRLAQKPDSDFGWGKGKENARLLGYAEAWLNRLPDCVWESAAAVGNPFSLGPVQTGETVVDIGCGSGADACVAALMVGTEGKVFGFDCTPAMVSKAARNAIASGLGQVVFQEAEMTMLPLSDASADLVISNGVINSTLSD
jgi:SAM-dependent methyltransferase